MLTIPNAGKDVEKPELSCIIGKSVNCTTTLEKVLKFSYKIKYTGLPWWRSG